MFDFKCLVDRAEEDKRYYVLEKKLEMIELTARLEILEKFDSNYFILITDNKNDY